MFVNAFVSEKSEVLFSSKTLTLRPPHHNVLCNIAGMRSVTLQTLHYL